MSGEETVTGLRDRDGKRFELDIEGQVVWADYRRGDGLLYIDHVEAPHALRGTGAAGRLMQALVTEARRREVRLVPVCGYAAAWLRRHAGAAAAKPG